MAAKQGKGKRIALWIIGILVGLLVLALLCVNVYVRVAYSSFYDEAQAEFDVPALNSGFVCQDLDYCDSAGCWLFSGYAAGGGASPLFRLDADDAYTSFTALLPDGSTYEDHGSGITSDGDYVFLTDDDGYLVFDASDVASVEDGGSVQAIDRVDLEITPAFLNVVSGALYAGTFHLIPDYPAPSEHHMTASDGSEHAGIVLVFPQDPSAAYGYAHDASRAYSIPDAAQGFCALPGGELMTSTSYGLSTSLLRTYDVSTTPRGGTFLVNGREVPLYFLDANNQTSCLEAPPMSEGIAYHDGRVYIAEESASNKYVFGKLYGAGRVYSIPAE